MARRRRGRACRLTALAAVLATRALLLGLLTSPVTTKRDRRWRFRLHALAARTGLRLAADTWSRRRRSLAATRSRRCWSLADTRSRRRRSLADTRSRRRRSLADTRSRRRRSLADTRSRRRRSLADTRSRRCRSMADTRSRRRRSLAETRSRRRRSLAVTLSRWFRPLVHNATAFAAAIAVCVGVPSAVVRPSSGPGLYCGAPPCFAHARIPVGVRTTGSRCQVPGGVTV